MSANKPAAKKVPANRTPVEKSPAKQHASRTTPGRARTKTPKSAPDFQLYRDYTDDEMDRLLVDIIDKGILQPITVDQYGVILDGNHRARAHAQLRAAGFKLPPLERRLVPLQSDLDRYSHAVSLNEVRRQLAPEDRALTEAKLREQGMSYRAIARLFNVSQTTVSRDLSGVTFVTPEKVRGLDGRIQSTKKHTVVSTFSDRDIERARTALEAFGDDVPSGHLTVSQLEKKERAHQVRLGVEPDDTVVTGPRWRIDCADLREWNVEANSVDCIITDPPYTTEGVPLYGELSKLAARILKPSGLLFAYVGKLHLLESGSLLASELEYFWTFDIVQASHPTRTPIRKIEGGHRPVLVFQKPPVMAKRWMNDTIVSTSGPEKDLHHWQQSLPSMQELVRRATKRGDLICDPFTGSGTSGVAAISLQRRFLGSEINPATAWIARDRMQRFDATKVAL